MAEAETRLEEAAFERFRTALGEGAMNTKGLAIDDALSVLTGVEFYRDHSGYLCASRDERRVAGPNSTDSVTYWSVLSDAAHALDGEAAARVEAEAQVEALRKALKELRVEVAEFGPTGTKPSPLDMEALVRDCRVALTSTSTKGTE